MHDAHGRADNAARQDPGRAEVLGVLDRLALNWLVVGQIRADRRFISRRVVQLAEREAVDQMQDQVADRHQWPSR